MWRLAQRWAGQAAALPAMWRKTSSGQCGRSDLGSDADGGEVFHRWSIRGCWYRLRLSTMDPMTTQRASYGLDLHKPFSRAEARAYGLPRSRLLSREFHKVCYDQYVVATVPITTRVKAQAALNISPAGSFASHHTAAELWARSCPTPRRRT